MDKNIYLMYILNLYMAWGIRGALHMSLMGELFIDIDFHVILRVDLLLILTWLDLHLSSINSASLFDGLGI